MSKPQTTRNSLEKPQGSSRPASRVNVRQQNGGERPQNGVADVIQDEDFQAHQKDRLLYLIMSSIGAQITVTTNSGTHLEGTLESIDPATMKVVLNTEKNVIAINTEDLIDFEISNVDLFNESQVRNSGSFKTDIAISNNKSGPRRGENIERWVSDTGKANASLEGLTLEDSQTGAWDQFHANEKKFGIKSEFDEHLYTTKINKDDPNYKRNVEKANQLAKEIESQGHSGNAHLAEERGLAFDDSGIDEEDKYSGVDRSQNVAKGDALFQSLMKKDSKNATFEQGEQTKYVPPTQRSRLEKIDPSIVSATNIPEKKPSTIPSKPQVSTSKQEHRKISTMKEINSLKEFSQNFKIPTKIPDDLLPIITKDKQRQEEIVKRSELEATKANSPQLAAPEPLKPAKAEKTKEPSPKAIELPQKSMANTPAAKKYETSKFKMSAKTASFTPVTFSSSSSVSSPVVSNASSPQFARNSPMLAQPGYRPKRAHFFPPAKVPATDKKKKLDDDFNFFRASRREFDAKNEKGATFRLERPFNTPPTWCDGTASYKSLFPDAAALKHQMFPPQAMQQFQPMPMMNGPGQFMYPPQPFVPMRVGVSPQQGHPGLSPQPMQPMYIQPGMQPPLGYPQPYPRFAGAPMPMMPPGSHGRSYKH